jgi:hypothetical protein
MQTKFEVNPTYNVWLVLWTSLRTDVDTDADKSNPYMSPFSRRHNKTAWQHLHQSFGKKTEGCNRKERARKLGKQSKYQTRGPWWPWVAHQKQLLFSVGMSIYSHIKLEHRIRLNNNLKKCHDLGHLRFSLNGASQINMSKMIKDYLIMLQSLVITYQLFQ